MLCRTLAEIEAAALAEAESDPPLTQEQADQVALILAPHIACAARPAQAA